MKLLKIILFLFIVYFIRRFIQMYRTIKHVQETQAANNQNPRPAGPETKNDIVNADFRVVD